MSTTLSINGVGFSATVEVEDGESYAEALQRAGLSQVEDLDLSVGGEEIAPGDSVPEGEQSVTATPKSASLG